MRTHTTYTLSALFSLSLLACASDDAQLGRGPSALSQECVDICEQICAGEAATLPAGCPDCRCPETCNPDLNCGQAITCVDGQLYPTTCGPANCDEPMGPCEDAGTCNPDLDCGQAITCVDGQWYPTTCGPANCDEPMGPCEDAGTCNPDLDCGQAITLRRRAMVPHYLRPC